MIPKIKFIFDRHKRANDSNKGTVELRITADKTQKFLSTGISCFPDQWDSKHEQVINTLDAMQLNEIITKMRIKAMRAINDMMDKDSFDLNEIIASVRTKKAVQTTFIGYIRKRMKKSLSLTTPRKHTMSSCRASRNGERLLSSLMSTRKTSGPGMNGYTMSSGLSKTNTDMIWKRSTRVQA